MLFNLRVRDVGAIYIDPKLPFSPETLSNYII